LVKKGLKKDTVIVTGLAMTEAKLKEDHEEDFNGNKSCISSSNQLPPRTIAEEDEDEIIAHLELI